LTTTSLSSAVRILALVLGCIVAACGSESPKFKNTDVTGVNYARGFELTDQNGKRRTLAEFKGKVVSVFFGYTQCPDVCPTTLAEMKEVRARLGADADRLQVLFVTVDPERDTPELLRNYVTAFDPSFLGLTGSPAEVAAVAKEFRVFYEKVPGKSPADYTMNHTAGSYVFDPAGHIRLFVRHGQATDVLAGDLKVLLAGG